MKATPAIDATGLVKTFGQLRAVDGIDLQVHQGEIFGVLGPNGAGKPNLGN
jgi:ABC-2 type transport system ATP-binding protein